MSDAQIRELERSARAGDPQAEERLLVARLRAGTIEGWQLELADACGSEVAARAMGRGIALALQLERVLARVASLMRAADEHATAKEAGVLAACAMVDVEQRHHHAARRGVFRVGEPAHRPGRRVRQAARALRYTDDQRTSPPEALDTCSDVTCDLAIRCVDAARAWATSPATRRDEEALCFSLAQMGARTGVYGDPLHPFQRHQLEGLKWPAVPCAMAAHEGGRPDLLEQLHERARRLPFDAARPRDLELRAAVCSALIAWALA